jgi:hypothetical protein
MLGSVSRLVGGALALDLLVFVPVGKIRCLISRKLHHRVCRVEPGCCVFPERMQQNCASGVMSP